MTKPIALAIALALTTAARAQTTPVADVAVGYSTFEVVKGYSLNAQGGSGAVAFNLTPLLGVIGDLGIYYAPSISMTAETYTFGPRFSYRHWPRLTPFAQATLGGGHASSAQSGFTGVTNAFAFGAGGGADFGLDRRGRFAFRPQLEYLAFRGNGSTTGTIRFSAGLVIRIGKK
ncbi:MAG TPA: hypothetical protein VF753_10060 [Terriglobales bacterium]